MFGKHSDSKNNKRSPHSENGGVVILIAFVLLILMSVTAMGLSRTTLRELVTTGTLVHGTKASEAAEAGIDWFITWSEGNNQNQASGGSGGNALLVTGIGNLTDPKWSTLTYPAGVSKLWDVSGRAWDRGITISSGINDASTNEMVFDATEAVVSQKRSGGNSITQKFDVSLRWLGFVPVSLTGGGGNSSGGTQLGTTGTQDLLWQVTSTGTATVVGPDIAFRQRRESIMQSSLGQK